MQAVLCHVHVGVALICVGLIFMYIFPVMFLFLQVLRLTWCCLYSMEGNFHYKWASDVQRCARADYSAVIDGAVPAVV